MKKEKKLYYFKTFAHSVVVITATNYAQAEEKATQKTGSRNISAGSH